MVKNRLYLEDGLPKKTATKWFSRSKAFSYENGFLYKSVRLAYHLDRVNMVKEVHRKSGHTGVNTMSSTLLTKFYWPKLVQDCANIKADCVSCQLFSSDNRYIHHTMPPRHLCVDTAMQRLGIDLIGPLPSTKNGNIYVLTIVDYLTKYYWAFALPNKEAKTIVKFLLHVIAQVGPPEEFL